jgi:hypothetical protein
MMKIGARIVGKTNLSLVIVATTPLTIIVIAELAFRIKAIGARIARAITRPIVMIVMNATLTE